jgi:hypothetical protein
MGRVRPLGVREQSADKYRTQGGNAGSCGVKSQGRVAQIGLTGKKKVPKLGEMC